MPSPPRALSGLYLILDPSLCQDQKLRDILQQTASAGVRLVQYRKKTASMKEAYDEALSLRKLAGQLGVTFIVNDRCDLALALDADGVHLGQTDLPYAYALKIMGAGKLIGLSTHNADQVKEAERLRPDYIGFGPIFKPGSKEDHDPVVGIEGLRHARALTTLPMFAIGGIAVENVEEIARAGANGIAVISAILQAPDCGRAVSDLLARLPARAS
jgi:thiamine-phosphate pyrophosphorylase